MRLRWLRNSLLALGFLVVAAYIASPWWLAFAIKAAAPTSVLIKQLELEYPTMRSIAIRKLELQSGNIALQVVNLGFTHLDESVTIDTIHVTVLASDEPELGSVKDILGLIFSMPNGLAKLLPQVDLVQGVYINEMQVENGRHLSRLKQVSIRPGSNQVQVDIAELNNEPLQLLLTGDKNSVLERVVLTLDDNHQQQMSLKLAINDQFLASITALETPEQDLLTLSVHSSSLIRTLVGPVAEHVKLSADTAELRFRKNTRENTYSADLTTGVQVDSKYLAQTMFGEASEDKNTQGFVEAIAQWQVNFASEISPNTSPSASPNTGIFTGLLAFNIELQEVFISRSAESLRKLEAAKFNLKAPFKILFAQSQKPSLTLDDLQLSAEAKALSMVHQVGTHQEQRASVEQPRLQATLTLDSPLQFDGPNISDLKSLRWHVVGELLSTRMVLLDGGGEVGDGVSSFVTPIKMNFNIRNDKALLTSGKLALPSAEIDLPNITAAVDINMVWQGIDLALTQGSARIDTSSLQHDFSGYSFNTIQSETSLAISRSEIAGTTKLLINEEAIAPSSFIYDRQSNVAVIDVAKEDVKLAIINYMLQMIGDQKKLPLAIVDGKLNHSARFVVGGSPDYISRLSVDDVQFSFGENTLYGLNISQELTSAKKNIYEATLSLDKVAFSSGLDVSSIKATVLAARNADMQVNITVEELQAELLEGKLSADTLHIEQGELLSSTISVDNLSLTELVFFLEISGLFAEGRLNFELPTSTVGGQLVVEQGRFESIGTGLIKYSTGTVVDAGEENIALRALRNFHYQSLDGTLSYNEKGEYLIKIHLLGSNPDLYDGYPIDFVLNLNGELSGVFRSLFLTGDFKEAVMQRVKTEQQ